MEKFPHVVASSPLEENRAREALDTVRRKETKPVPGEREKNDLDLKMIALIHQMHSELFSRFSLGGVPTFYDEQIHMVAADVYAKSLPPDEAEDFLQHSKVSPAGYRRVLDQIYIWETENTTHERRFVYLLHETLHLISHQVVTALFEERTVDTTSMGIGETMKFGLIDEAIIQTVVQVLCSEYGDELKAMGLQLEAVTKTSYSARREEVANFREVLVPVMAKNLGIPEAEVHIRSVKSFFTGSPDFINMCREVWGEVGVDLLALCDMSTRPVYTKEALQCLRLTKDKIAACAERLDTTA
jgi:hypothetical protein